MKSIFKKEMSRPEFREIYEKEAKKLDKQERAVKAKIGTSPKRLTKSS